MLAAPEYHILTAIVPIQFRQSLDHKIKLKDWLAILLVQNLSNLSVVFYLVFVQYVFELVTHEKLQKVKIFGSIQIWPKLLLSGKSSVFTILFLFLPRPAIHVQADAINYAEVVVDLLTDLHELVFFVKLFVFFIGNIS